MSGDILREMPGELIFDFGLPMMFFGTLLSLLFFGALLAFGVWAVRQFTQKPAGPSRALQILQERLARGEIDVEEYERLRRTLTAG